jgi:hypothetical protein
MFFGHATLTMSMALMANALGGFVFGGHGVIESRLVCFNFRLEDTRV